MFYKGEPNMHDKNMEEIEKTNSEAAVVLHCSSEDLRDFISGLLGRPQTISKTFRGAFDVTADHVQDLHSLITQRVYQQNKASLIQFTAKIVFDDNSSVLLNSLAEFMTYREVRPISSQQLHLTWSFLVEFQDKRIPEKQEIDISFIASGRPTPIYEENVAVLISGKLYGGGFINFRIQHTARTWGADIEALLSGHIKNILVPPPKLREFAWKHSSKISVGVAIIFFIAALFFSFWTASSLWSSQQNQISQYIGDSTPIDSKIDFVLKTISSAIWAKYYFSVIVFLVISLALAILLGIWVDSAADTNKPSFIVLTEQARREKEKQLNKYHKKLISFILSISTSVGAGLVSNYLFHYLWKLK
jgi:hypothetical protein